MSVLSTLKQVAKTALYGKQLQSALSPAPEPSGPRKPMTVAVIGAGAQGRDHCLGLSSIPNVSISAIVDRREESLAKLKSEHQLGDARLLTDLAQLLAGPLPDMAIIATTTTSHLEIAEQLASSGVRRLIVEKPIGHSVTKSKQFAELCREKGTYVAVNHSRRWSADFAGIRRVVEKGYIGDLKQIHCTPGPGGMAMIGSHYLDLVAMLGGAQFVEIVGGLYPETGPNRRGAEFSDPAGWCRYRLGNGVTGTVETAEDGSRFDGCVVLKGSAGRIEVDDRAKVWRLTNDTLGSREFPFAQSTRLRDYCARISRQMLTDRPMPCGLTEGIAALEAVMAVHLSHESGEPVCLPLPVQLAGIERPFP